MFVFTLLTSICFYLYDEYCREVIVFVNISAGVQCPTQLIIKNNTTSLLVIFSWFLGVLLLSPLSTPSIINVSIQQNSVTKNYMMEIFKNDRFYNQRILPLSELHHENRGNICGVLVKVSSCIPCGEDKLYQVFLVDESTQVPFRVSVYLHNEDANAYFQVWIWIWYSR